MPVSYTHLTPLAKMGSAAEMISHLPFVTGGVGEYMVLGHGVPVIYLSLIHI